MQVLNYRSINKGGVKGSFDTEFSNGLVVKGSIRFSSKNGGSDFLALPRSQIYNGSAFETVDFLDFANKEHRDAFTQAVLEQLDHKAENDTNAVLRSLRRSSGVLVEAEETEQPKAAGEPPAPEPDGSGGVRIATVNMIDKPPFVATITLVLGNGLVIENAVVSTKPPNTYSLDFPVKEYFSNLNQEVRSQPLITFRDGLSREAFEEQVFTALEERHAANKTADESFVAGDDTLPF
jgi:hypothetical protein